MYLPHKNWIIRIGAALNSIESMYNNKTIYFEQFLLSTTFPIVHIDDASNDGEKAKKVWIRAKCM